MPWSSRPRSKYYANISDEVEHRRNAKVQRLVYNATFRSTATPEGIDFAAARNLDKKQVAELSTSRFIAEGNNLLIVGPTGVGKSYFATAIAMAACRNRRSTLKPLAVRASARLILLFFGKNRLSTQAASPNSI